MSVQILVMTNDSAGVAGIQEALEARRARVVIQPLDESILVVAREARPSAVLLDVSLGDDDARAIMDGLRADESFEGVPIFALFGSLDGATSYYEDLSQPTNAASEILAIAELNAGFSDTSGGGIFDGIEPDVDFDQLIGPAKSKTTSATASAPPRRPPPPPPVGRPGARTAGSSPAIPIPSSDGQPRRPRTASNATVGGGDVLALREELNQRDRELLDSRAKILELERALLDKDGSRLEGDRQVTELQAQLDELEAELDAAKQAAQEREEAITTLQAEVRVAAEAAAAVQSEFEERKQEFQELLDAREAELIAEGDQRIAALHDEYEELIATRVADAVNNALEEANRGHEQALQAALEAAAQNTEREEELAKVSAQRDEVLAISQEMEAALAQADLQVETLVERLRLADALIDALRTDLGAYAAAAHEATSAQRGAIESIQALAQTLAAAQEAVANASAIQTPELPETTWETAFVAWQDAAANDETDAEILEEADELIED